MRLSRLARCLSRLAADTAQADGVTGGRLRPDCGRLAPVDHPADGRAARFTRLEGCAACHRDGADATSAARCPGANAGRLACRDRKRTGGRHDRRTVAPWLRVIGGALPVEIGSGHGTGRRRRPSEAAQADGVTGGRTARKRHAPRIYHISESLAPVSPIWYHYPRSPSGACEVRAAGRKCATQLDCPFDGRQ